MGGRTRSDGRGLRAPWTGCTGHPCAEVSIHSMAEQIPVSADRGAGERSRRSRGCSATELAPAAAGPRTRRTTNGHHGPSGHCLRVDSPQTVPTVWGMETAEQRFSLRVNAFLRTGATMTRETDDRPLAGSRDRARGLRLDGPPGRVDRPCDSGTAARSRARSLFGLSRD